MSNLFNAKEGKPDACFIYTLNPQYKKICCLNTNNLVSIVLSVMVRGNIIKNTSETQGKNPSFSSYTKPYACLLCLTLRLFLLSIEIQEEKVTKEKLSFGVSHNHHKLMS